ncbi:MAG: hypothetical protein Kow00104_10710 [Rhodothalassiaceae bacterium]
MIDPRDAGARLGDIARVKERTERGLSYRKAAPHLFLWSAVWFVGYGLAALSPDLSVQWAIVVPVGIAGSTIIGRRNSGGSGHVFKYLASAALLFGLVLALAAILPPLDGRQVGVLFPLFVATIYGGIGIWTCHAKIGLTGAAVGGIALAAYVLAGAWFDAAMAVLGAGALALGGLWMRRW